MTRAATNGGEWVDLWARDLAENRKVTYHQWDSDAGSTASPEVYGTSKPFGSAKPMAVWNLSYTGVDADYAQNLIDVPASPDGVILSSGTTETATRWTALSAPPSRLWSGAGASCRSL